MCTRPSRPGRIVTKAPKSISRDDLALVDPPDFDVGGDQLDAALRLARRPRR